MVYDGRYHLSAHPIPPSLHHPHAPAVGDLCAQALRSSYLYSQHQATLIGTQTYARRLRFANMTAITASTSSRIAEWCAVDLAAHHTHVLGAFAIERVEDAMRDITYYFRVVVVEGANTDTGEWSSFVLPRTEESDSLEGESLVLPLIEMQASVALSNVTRPSVARVYLESYRNSDHDDYGFLPAYATAWRVTIP